MKIFKFKNQPQLLNISFYPFKRIFFFSKQNHLAGIFHFFLIFLLFPSKPNLKISQGLKYVSAYLKHQLVKHPFLSLSVLSQHKPKNKIKILNKLLFSWNLKLYLLFGVSIWLWIRSFFTGQIQDLDPDQNALNPNLLLL